MTVSNPYITPVDPSVYSQLLDILGLTSEMEPIDVDATVVSTDHPTDHEISRTVGRSVGAGLGHLKNTVTKIPSFFARRETKASVMIAHWVTWSMVMLAFMSMTTSLASLMVLATIWVYVSNLIFESIQNF